MLIDSEKVKTVGDLAAEIKRLAKRHETKHGLDDWSCSLLDVARIIDDSLDADLAIGGDVIDNSIEYQSEIDRLKAENARFKRLAGLNEQSIQDGVASALNVVNKAFDYDESVKSIELAISNVNKLPRCAACYGKGEVKPLFYVYECSACHGTGRDMTKAADAVIAMYSVVELQQAELIKARGLLFQHGLTEKQREDYSVVKFYEDKR